ncbi:helix-turn-helix domain-containing protein [Enterococcus hermanniensis]|uniref:Mga helix-turn-helix domain-containing protein n=1 Tax=Enterococcus hermanniensis TaxID=249189 RepID=A0A1L8TMY6_9ENTE|nr:helix-turn-helix domain-containing protein [Enterococcus hermanniensis]OJG45676.1 hypothetical protein RV04_GL001965 [Enterococcus hermanniensis]
MRRLLKNTTQRRLAIIGVLRDLLGWQPPEMIAELLDCSTKTVLSDVEAINDYWGEHVGVEYSRTNGLRLNESLHNKTRQLARNLMEESEAFLFLERLFFQPNEDIDYWLNELYISEATFYRMVKQIDNVLEEKGLILKRRPFYITAENECWVREFYVQLFLEKYGINEWPFDVEREAVIAFIRKMNQSFKLDGNDRELLETSYLLAVTIVRTAQDFYSKPMANVSIHHKSTEKILALRPFAERVVQSTNYSMTNHWQVEVANSLLGNYVDPSFSKDYSETLEALGKFIDELEHIYEVSLTAKKKQHLIERLLRIKTNYQFYPYSRTILFDSDAYFTRNAQSQFPHFTKYVHQLLLQLERTTGDPWFSQFHFSVLAVLFKEWEGLALSLDIRSSKVKILVVSDSGRSHAKMIAELIQSRFYYRVMIKTYEGSVLELSSDGRFKNYDLVVTNFPIQHYPYSNLKIIDDFLTEADLSAIGAVIKEIH